MPAPLAPAVAFWVDVFTRYTRSDVLIHDRVEPGRIYEVVHGVPGGGEEALTPRVEPILDRLRLGQLWEPDPIERLTRPDAALAASAPVDRDRVRFQRGMREAFADGLARSRRYRRMVEQALVREGLPRELVALPLVESSYNPDATSSAGAAGLWQLTTATAQPLLEIGPRVIHVNGRVRGRRKRIKLIVFVDERRHPERATQAAVELLRRFHERLGSWPLAITAYNHGPNGIDRARRALGSDDLGVLVSRYRGPGFGFASRNFYAEFLAALHVLRNESRYFPDIAPPDRVIEYEVKRGDSLFTVARRHGVTVPTLRSTNGLRSERLRPGQLLLIRL